VSAQRWFRRLLRILPLDFRSDYGREMEQVFRDQQREAAARGRLSLVRVWMASAGAVLAIGPREHAAQFAQDVRYALRGMRAHPGFVLVAIVMIALGTGTNAAMFSVVDAVLVRSPFPDSSRLAFVRPLPAGPLSVQQGRAVLAAAAAFEAIGAMGGGGRVTLRGFGEPRRMNTECVTADMFKVLGTPPLAGRTFAADEDRPGAPAVVVLSYQFWQRELGGAADAVGRAVTLNNVPTTIVGIMPRAFGGPYSRNTNDGWLPLGPGIGAESPVGCTARAYLWLFARVRAGATFDATAEQAMILSGLARIPDAKGKAGTRIVMTSLDEHTTGDVRSSLIALLGSVGLVLLIACANVTNLQMERLFGRRREIAVRMAIGASRARVVRQALTETLILYAAGCAAGVLAANWTLGLIVALLPGSMPHLIDIQMNGRILAATFTIACAAGLMVGLVPVLQASSPRLVEDLRASTGTTRPAATLTRTTLVVGQVALSLVLLVGAMLLIRTFLTLRPTSPGFTTSDKVTAFVRLQGARAATPAAFFDPLFERLRAIPGVQGVTGSSYVPVSGSVGIATIRTGEKPLEVFSGIVLANYFAEMQIPLVSGRAFDARDRAGTEPVTIVNEALVRRLGIKMAGVGATLVVTGIDGKTTDTRRVVGISRDTRSNGGDTRARAELYVPFTQSPYLMMNLIVRTSVPSDPRIGAAIREAVTAVDADQMADRLMPLADMLDARVADWRFGAWLLGVFAAMALVLAAIGLAASIAWWVAQRSREIGVRMALGADAGQVAGLVVRQGLTLGGTGVVLGLAGAAASTRLLESWLYGVKPLDAPTFAWAAAGMLVIAALASYLPARRAARIDPLVTLRAE
jgi:putative ABC transport system permease protein